MVKLRHVKLDSAMCEDCIAGKQERAIQERKILKSNKVVGSRAKQSAWSNANTFFGRFVYSLKINAKSLSFIKEFKKEVQV
jgi:hypothetical protein